MGADRIMNGPLSSAGTNPYDQQAILLDAQNGTLAVSGSSRKISLLRSAVLSLSAQPALAAITAAQTLLSQVFNAGALNVTGRKLKVSGSLIYSTTITNVATISIAVTLGGVTLCTITTAATNTAASANLPVQFEFTIGVASLGAAATLEAHGRLDANIGTVAAADSATYLDTNSAVSAAVNLLAAATLAVTIAGSAAIPSAQLRSATVELIA
jgi:hypothetical protein